MPIKATTYSQRRAELAVRSQGFPPPHQLNTAGATVMIPSASLSHQMRQVSNSD
jgi:hypothetical protein